VASIELSGIRTHNLKGIDVSFPLNKLTAVSGVSGSGKSSLVFHTLHAQSYRRYVDSLSSYARQYLKSFPKPHVDKTVNLPPSIAVRQSRGAGYRSTVGSMTEIDDLLRVIFVSLAQPHCPNGHGVIKAMDVDDMLQYCMSTFMGMEVIIAAPLEGLLAGFFHTEAVNGEGVEQSLLSAQGTSKTKKQASKKLQKEVGATLLNMLKEQGFVRLMDGSTKMLRLTDMSPATLGKHGDEYSVVIDRLLVSEEESDLLRDGLSKALQLGKGLVGVVSEQKDVSSIVLRSGLSCLKCDYKAKPLKAHMLQARHPLGACPRCQGYGRSMVWDWSKIFSSKKNPHHSLEEILPFFSMKGGDVAFERLVKGVSGKGIAIDKPFSHYTQEEKDWIKWGHWPHFEAADQAIVVDGSTKRRFGGIIEYIYSLQKNRGVSVKFHLGRYRRYIKCPLCLGMRLRKEVMAFYVADMTFPMLQRLSVSDLMVWLKKHVPAKNTPTELQDALREMYQRLGYLSDIGLEYMSMHREAASLSGGELQRINMARCLGSALSQSLYCLDEPTAGLHPLDAARLLKVMQSLRDQGNTVVVVEHDLQTLLGCDHLLHIGPQAGHKGGHLEFAGKPADFLSSQKKQLSALVNADHARVSMAHCIHLKGVRTHNLKGVDIEIPLGSIVGVCGVSGSGKTSLIRHSFYPAMCMYLGVIEKHKDLVDGVEYDSIGPKGVQHHLKDVALVSQDALGRSSRGTIATYLGIAAPLRDLFAATDGAKRKQFRASTFSFNTPGGRCETCLGVGTVVEDLSFLGQLTVQCPSCLGKRFGPEVLGVRYHGKNIDDVLTMTVEEAHDFFCDHRVMQPILSQVMDLGLGYISLGQSTSSFSGGEAQRLKILKLLVQQSSIKEPQLLIFDEPTGGLSEEDVEYLWCKLEKLKHMGHTIIIIEHHLALLRSVDWLIEVGPGAGLQGGEIIFQGTPRELNKRDYLLSSMADFLYNSSKT